MPRSRRGKRALLVLIAYVDDSQEDHARKADPIFVLAGYIAPEEQWELFADEWEARLPLVRPSTSFKMSEVAARWGVHDERIMFFYRVIEQYVSGAFSCIVPVRDVQAAFAKFPLRLGSPGIYSMMFSAVLDWLCNPRAQADLGISGKIRFIFDTQMFEDTKIMERWDRLLHYMPESTKALLANMPQFEAEEDFMPLQAADFYAWWARKHWKDHPEHRISLGKPYKWLFPWEAKKAIPCFEVSWGEAEVTAALLRASADLWTTTANVGGTLSSELRARARF
jgi:hypothetical protein